MIGPLPYIGGKTRLAKEIIALFPEHQTYVEPFAGGAQVLFRKIPSAVEVMNDLDGEIVNFFRVCQRHHEEFLRHLRFTLISRRAFELTQMTSPESLTDIERAARFFYLQKNAFGGRRIQPNFHYGVTHPSNYNPKRIAQIIEKTYRRLRRVQIESLPYEAVLQRYDRPTTLFYLDPPYWGKKLYRFNFKEEDFVKLEQRLRNLRGRFVLSLNDAPEVRKLFGRFVVETTDVTYTARIDSGKRYGEVLVRNF